MSIRRSCCVALFTAALALAGCGDDTVAEAPAGSGGTGEAAPTAAQGGFAAGKVTMGDGSLIKGEIKDIGIGIHGVSEASERVSYSPAVKADGTYRQRLAPGEYGFHPGRITVLYNNAELMFPLEPVGNLWNKNRPAEEGIAQDWMWKVTGPTPYGQGDGLDPNNATHWYGMSIGFRPDGWRNDISAAPAAIPDGTKLVISLKPIGKAIDGSDVQPLQIERTFSNQGFGAYDLNDLVPVPYEVTAAAVLPDGSTKQLLLQGQGDYPNYKPSVKVEVFKDNILGKMAKPGIAFVME